MYVWSYVESKEACVNRYYTSSILSPNCLGIPQPICSVTTHRCSSGSCTRSTVRIACTPTNEGAHQLPRSPPQPNETTRSPNRTTSNRTIASWRLLSPRRISGVARNGGRILQHRVHHRARHLRCSYPFQVPVRLHQSCPCRRNRQIYSTAGTTTERQVVIIAPPPPYPPPYRVGWAGGF
jgi:hypothetical protein